MEHNTIEGLAFNILIPHSWARWHNSHWLWFHHCKRLGCIWSKLEIPALTQGKPQLSQRDVELSKHLSEVCIYVEQVIGNLKDKYTFLKGPLPVNLLKHKNNKGASNIDKVIAVCASLINLYVSVVNNVHYISYAHWAFVAFVAQHDIVQLISNFDNNDSDKI